MMKLRVAREQNISIYEKCIQVYTPEDVSWPAFEVRRMKVIIAFFGLTSNQENELDARH